ncbi:recombinase family protein [Niallia nealsonii]|uniref:Resolvase n=1 Tax=Niallia nealsonii TaxID=115979 RepID=A0A2N0Z472_9BACI|nr:recombinase family protein [Niallia nealsonii]PKG24279.1 resolvase [Niallia nealsonii]
MNQPTRVAIYGRVSTEEQAEHGYSIDAQLDTLQTYCKMHQKIVYKEYVDRGISGKSMEGRYELQRLLLDAKNKEFDEVIVWKINRISRRTIDLLKIVDDLNRYGITFRSFSENFETETPMGRFALQMLGAVGELERNTIVDNVKMGMKERARTGQWNGGIVLGYHSTKSYGDRKRNNSKLETVPSEAAIVRKIFGLYASGKGLKAIANQLNHEELVTKRGNSFSTSAIKEILLNPIYIGKIRFNRYENWNEQRRKGKSDNPIIVDGEHEAIISPELWEKVQHLQRKKSKVHPRHFEGNYTLTGLLRCPQCGASMVSSRTINRSKDGEKIVRRYYSCGAFRSKGSSVCSANSVRADESEQYVYQRIKEVIIHPKILKDIVSQINNDKKLNVQPLRKELQQIDKKLEQYEAKRKKYFGLYEEDSIDKELLVERLDELKKEADLISTRKSEIEWQLQEDNSQTLDYSFVKNILSQIDKLLQSASADKIKALLHLAIKQITVKERKIDTIVLAFDENNVNHFLSCSPSDRNSEGAFALPKQKHRFTIVI